MGFMLIVVLIYHIPITSLSAKQEEAFITASSPTKFQSYGKCGEEAMTPTSPDPQGGRPISPIR